MRALAAIACLLIAACSQEQAPAPTYHADEAPQSLSQWGMIVARDGRILVNDDVTPYDIATPLFTDYALKLRTVWLPPESRPAAYDGREAFDFPIGSVITKTFYYMISGEAFAIGEAPALSEKSVSLDEYRMIETRLLVRRPDRWEALAYVWNDAQTDARLQRTGAIIPMTLMRGERTEQFAYIVPDKNQCAACHASDAATRKAQPIGLKARHLNKASAYSPGFNQLDHWIASGLLTAPEVDVAPANAIWTDADAPLKARARAYLDINCSHCHNPRGAAKTSGLNLEPEAHGPALGLCKPPIAAGGGTGGRRFAIVPGAPDDSITLFRMETIDPAAMMPELGRSLSHEEGVQLVSDWIASMDGACG